MSPRPDVSEERRKQILEAATRVFAERGFQKARMDDVVEASGLSKGALYWYFDSKDDLIVGIVQTLLDRELNQLKDLGEIAGPARARLEQFAENTIQDFQQLVPILPMMYEFFGLAARSQSIQSMFRRYFRSYLDILVPIIQQGIDDGEFRPSDPREVAIALGAIMEGTILLMGYDPEVVDVETHIRAGVRLALEGLVQ